GHMSFQGDVSGIGLADLLQSLSRGKDGVLHLDGEELRARLGLQRGSVRLLAANGEDAEAWMSRARAAVASAADDAQVAELAPRIARAARLEALYGLLDSPSLHFRFEPGPLEQGEADGAFEAPLPLEALLLEYARLADDRARMPAEWMPLGGEVAFQSGLACDSSSEHARFVQACDGSSSVAELADKLGVALRQAQLWTATALRQGDLYLSSARDLWALARHELQSARFERATARIDAALAASEPGPLSEELARLFDHEWQAGRLEAALKPLSHAARLRFLRKLDPAAASPAAALSRARAHAKLAPDDLRAALHVLRAASWAGSTKEPSWRELCELAKRLLAARKRLAAEPVLRVLSQRTPANSVARFEVGALMLDAGMGHEAAPWIVETARELLQQKKPQKALPSLKALVELAPEHPEARALLSRARAMAMRQALVRKHTLAGLCIALCLSAMGVVRWRETADRERRILEVRAIESQPERALRLLAAHFPEEGDPFVDAWRESLAERALEDAQADCSAWMRDWKAAASLCASGDLMLGVERGLALPPPPPQAPGFESLPPVADLAGAVEARIGDMVLALPDEPGTGDAELAAEEHLRGLLAELRSQLAARDEETWRRLATRLAEVDQRLVARTERRARLVQAADHWRRIEAMNLLIGAARLKKAAGDWTGAASDYEGIVALDLEGAVRASAAEEFAEAFRKRDALAEAERLALAGQHERAIAELQREFPGEARALPWRLDVFPADASIELPDGSRGAAPLVVRSAAGEKLRLVATRAGCHETVLLCDAPKDRLLHLQRKPDFELARLGRVSAPPISCGDGHVLVDRSALVLRCERDGSVAWRARLDSLAGFARAPAPLPERPEQLLLVDEDGAAWLVDARDGSAAGPTRLPAPPRSGPVVEDGRVLVELVDGRVAAFAGDLRFELATPSSFRSTPPTPARSGLRVLARTDEARRLDDGGAGWSATVEPEGVFVRRAERLAFVAERGEDWEWIAFEERGSRLWISDGRSVRV
ncbi:MAG: hypothetical protein RL112_2799, partial [Planctomycetota bacterium]